MQQMSTYACQNTPTPSSTATSSSTTRTTNTNLVPEKTLVDTRDDKTYVVRKLADGNCWMVQNLDLGDSAKNIPLTKEDTDIISDYVIDPIQTAVGPKWDTYGVDGLAHIYEQGNIWYANGITLTNTNTGNPVNHAGNSYNWIAATAESGTSATVGNAPHSICSTGWQLPVGDSLVTGSADKSFEKLLKSYNITINNIASSDSKFNDAFTRVSKFPLDFVRAGCYAYGGTLNNRNESTFVWTSTAYSSSSSSLVYTLRTHTSYFWPHGSAAIGDGFAIRCVAR